MLINLTNHPQSIWPEKQLAAASLYGGVMDLPFPNIAPDASENDILELAGKYLSEILSLHPDAVLVAGEFTFAFAITDALLAKGITVLAATSERVSVETRNPDGTISKQNLFDFVAFREYRRIPAPGDTASGRFP